MRRPRRPRRFSRAFLFLLPALLLLAACSGSTWYRLTVDGLTFLSEEERSGSFAVNTSSIEYLYFLPDFGHYENENSVSAELQHGFLVEYPTPDILDTGSGEIRAEIHAKLSFEADTDITNVDLQGSVFLAEKGSDNIYGNGQEVGSTDVETKNNAKWLTLHAEIEKGDDAYSLLRTGSFRSGVQVKVISTVSDTEIQYEVHRLLISVEARPFSFIP